MGLEMDICQRLREETVQIHCSWIQGDRALSHYSSFNQKVALARPFLVTMGKPLDVHCSGLTEDRASSQCDSFTWKMVLKKPFAGDTGHYIWNSLFCLPIDRAWSWYTFILKVKWPGTCWWYWGEKLSGLCGLLGQSSSCWWSYTWKMVLKWQNT